MTQLPAAAIAMPRESAADARSRFSTDSRRWLQLAFAVIWLFDGLLQCQTYMFSRDFATHVLAQTAAGNPGWISDSILWSARIVEANPILANSVFAALQLAIGLAIAWRRSLKAGLAVSIAWSLLVWWFGEGLGGLLGGGTSALAGAPGAVLLYLVLAILLWPTGKDTSTTFVAAAPVGQTAARILWVALWGGLAALNLQPMNLRPGAVRSMVAGMGADQPSWLAALINGYAALTAHEGIALTVGGAVILLLIAFGIFLPPRWIRAVVIAAIVVSAFIWVIGEALGAVFGGQATDVNSGPLLALIALAYWPSRRAARSSDARGVGA